MISFLLIVIILIDGKVQRFLSVLSGDREGLPADFPNVIGVCCFEQVADKLFEVAHANAARQATIVSRCSPILGGRA